MGVAQAQMQTVEDIYQLVRFAALNRRPIRAIYHDLDRWLCPHKLGWNPLKHARVLCYQFGGESESGLQAAGSPENWRCLAVEKLNRVEQLDGQWHTAPNHTRPQTCITEVDVDVDVDVEDAPQ